MRFSKPTRGDDSPILSVEAWLPGILALAATGVLVGYLGTGPHEPTLVVENGIARADESAAARAWQVLMLLQLPAMAWFALRWLPKRPLHALGILAIQCLVFMAAGLPVVLLES